MLNAEFPVHFRIQHSASSILHSEPVSTPELPAPRSRPAATD
jgi:hypothetical protein